MEYMSGKFEHFHTLIHMLELDLNFQSSLMKIDLTSSFVAYYG
jgi:hypothetical protein